VAVTASCTHTTPALLEIPTVFTPCSFLFVDLSARLEGETDKLACGHHPPQRSALSLEFGFDTAALVWTEKQKKRTRTDPPRVHPTSFSSTEIGTSSHTTQSPEKRALIGAYSTL